MKVRETIGTTVRTMVKMKVTTNGDQHQDMANVATEVRERGEKRRVCGDEGLDTVWLRPTLYWFIAQYDFILFMLKSEGEA